VRACARITRVRLTFCSVVRLAVADNREQAAGRVSELLKWFSERAGLTMSFGREAATPPSGTDAAHASALVMLREPVRTGGSLGGRVTCGLTCPDARRGLGVVAAALCEPEVESDLVGLGLDGLDAVEELLHAQHVTVLEQVSGFFDDVQLLLE